MKNLIKINVVIIISAFIIILSGIKIVSGKEANPTQVKLANDSTVYYIDYSRGVKKAYVNEVSYLTYGNSWEDVRVISEDFLNKWRDLRLVKTDTSPAVYYIKDKKKTLIKNEADFVSYGFDWSDIIKISTKDLNQYYEISNSDMGLTGSTVSLASTVSSTQSENNEKTTLTVVNSSFNSSSNVLALNSKDNLVFEFSLKSTNGDSQIERFVFNLGGIYQGDLVESAVVKNDNGTAYNARGSIRDRKIEFNFRKDSVYIKSGETKKFKVYVDLNNIEITNSTFQISINSPENILSNSEVSGSFPIKGAISKLANSKNVIGAISVNEVETMSNGQDMLVGSTNQVVARFNVQETSKNENIIISEIAIINRGSAWVGDISNFKLMNKSNREIAQVNKMKDSRVVTFNIGNYEINRGTSESFFVVADVVAGDSKTINFDIYNMKAKGAMHNIGINEDYNNLTEVHNITRKYLGVLSKDLTASKNVYSSQQGVMIGNFEIRNNNQKIILDNITMSLEKSSVAPSIDEMVYVVNYDTGEVYDSFSGEDFADGPVIFATNAQMDPKASIKLAVITNIPTEAGNGDYYRVIVNRINYKADNNTYYEDVVSIPGARFIVNRSNVYIYPNKDTENYAYIKGQKGVKIASFIIEAAAGDDVVISNITLTKGNTSGVISYENGFSNLTTYIGRAKASNPISKPVSGSYVFEGFNYKLKAGQRVEVKVYVDTDQELRADRTSMMLTNLTVSGYNSGMPTVISKTDVESFVTNFGNTEAEINAGNDGSIIKSEVYNMVGSFTIRNTGAEDIKLKSVLITTSNEGFSSSLGYRNLQIVRKDTNRRVGATSYPVAGGNKIGLGNNLVKPEDGAVEYEVYVDAKDVGEEVDYSSFQIDFSEIEAYGATSGIGIDLEGDPTSSITVSIN